MNPDCSECARLVDALTRALTYVEYARGASQGPEASEYTGTALAILRAALQPSGNGHDRDTCACPQCCPESWGDQPAPQPPDCAGCNVTHSASGCALKKPQPPALAPAELWGTGSGEYEMAESGGAEEDHETCGECGGKGYHSDEYMCLGCSGSGLPPDRERGGR